VILTIVPAAFVPQGHCQSLFNNQQRLLKSSTLGMHLKPYIFSIFCRAPYIPIHDGVVHSYLFCFVLFWFALGCNFQSFAQGRVDSIWGIAAGVVIFFGHSNWYCLLFNFWVSAPALAYKVFRSIWCTCGRGRRVHIICPLASCQHRSRIVDRGSRSRTATCHVLPPCIDHGTS
jgi:hypothetical protein